MIDEIFACAIILISVSLTGYVTYLNNIIDLKMNDQKVTLKNLLFHHKLTLFRHKLNLNENYPKRDVYLLSKKYDKLIPYYYAMYFFIAAVTSIMILIHR